MGKSVQMAYKKVFSAIYKQIHQAQHFDDVAWRIEDDVLQLLGAESMLLFRLDQPRHELVAWVKPPVGAGEELRLPVDAASIEGYVAISRQPLRIDNVHDEHALAGIYARLAYDDTYDSISGYLTTQMIAVPLIYQDQALGVLRVNNCLGAGAFSDQDAIHALAVAQIIGQHFHSELQAAGGPFDLLVRRNRVAAEELERLSAKSEQEGISLARLLTKEASVPPEELGEALAEFYQVPFMAYDEDLLPDTELMETLNISYLARNLWVPFRTRDGELVILIDDPSDSERLMEIQYLLASQAVEYRVGLQEDILRFLGFEIDDEKAEYSLEDIVGKLTSTASVVETLEDEAEDEDDLLNEDQPAIIQLVNRLIVDAVDLRASDIHVEPGKDRSPAVVRMRIDGECRPVLQIPASHTNAVVARIKILSRLDIAEKRLPQDGKMTVKLRGEPLELRVATVPTVHGENVVMRVLATGEPMKMEQLNLTPANTERILEMVQHPHGIMLVVGPTGSGKTTTLHALLAHINTPVRKIWTAEDPVEITQPGLQQVQIHPRIGLDFARVLRSFLRADPDVILIGEMRDKETAHAGIEASLTGHLVFSTLHTNSAPETIVRLLDMELDPMNFADALIGVLAQRLVRTLCRRCKQTYEASEEELVRLRHFYGEEDWDRAGLGGRVELCRGVGCEACNGSGYKGRTGIHELLVNTPEMKRLVSRSSPVDDIRELAFGQGMRTLLQDGIGKVLAGQTDLDQVRKITTQ